jgi:hypothetical protein
MGFGDEVLMGKVDLVAAEGSTFACIFNENVESPPKLHRKASKTHKSVLIKTKTTLRHFIAHTNLDLFLHSLGQAINFKHTSPPLPHSLARPP